jgi:integrase
VAPEKLGLLDEREHRDVVRERDEPVEGHCTGLRWGDATALRVDRVHLDRRRVTVAVAFVSVHGEVVESTPRSHRHREVPMPRFLADQLGEHIAGKGPRELVFTTEWWAPLRSSNFRQRYWLDAVKECGLAGLRVHDLRHTAASLAVNSGANPKAVQQMPGHASAAMTLDVYAARSIRTSTTWPIGSTKRPERRAVCPRCVPTRV